MYSLYIILLVVSWIFIFCFYVYDQLVARCTKSNLSNNNNNNHHNHNINNNNNDNENNNNNNNINNVIICNVL